MNAMLQRDSENCLSLLDFVKKQATAKAIRGLYDVLNCKSIEALIALQEDRR